jgi:hypothetical protein
MRRYTRYDGRKVNLYLNYRSSFSPSRISPFVFTQHLLSPLKKGCREPDSDVRIVNVSKAFPHHPYFLTPFTRRFLQVCSLTTSSSMYRTISNANSPKPGFPTLHDTVTQADYSRLSSFFSAGASTGAPKLANIL